MRWANYDLNWGRPLKSIIALLDNNIIDFDFFHLKAGNFTTIDGPNEENLKKIANFKSYLNILRSQNIILDEEKRKNLVLKKKNSICNNKNLSSKFSEKLVEEVVNLV